MRRCTTYQTCVQLTNIHVVSAFLPSDWLQVSQYTFAMCSYREKKAEPVELLQLDGYTVDYTDPQPGDQSHSTSLGDFTQLLRRQAAHCEV